MKKVKVFFLCDSLQSEYGNRQLINIIRYLDQEKFTVYLLPVKKNGELEERVPSSVFLYNLKERKGSLDLVKIVWIIKKIRPNIIFTNSNYTHRLSYVSSKFISNFPASVMRFSDTKKSSCFSQIFIKKAYSAAAKVIVINENKAEVINKYNLKSGKITQIPFMIDKKYIKKEAACPVGDKKIRDKEKLPLLITSGPLIEGSGHDILLKAFAAFRIKNRGFFIILGSGPRKKYLEDFSNRLGINRDLLFVQEKANPYKYIRKADIYLASLNSADSYENILVAMLCKTPVIATDFLRGGDNIITPGLDGILTEPQNPDAMAEEIKRLIANRNLRLRLADNAYKIAAKFSADKVIKQYKELFFGIVHTSSTV